MAGPRMSVSPYWELVFDADGDTDAGRRDRLLAGAAERGVRDLIVVAHGWNNDRSFATGLYSRFLAPVPALAPAARIGYAGVLWPSMRFTDEPIPDFPRTAAPQPDPGPGLSEETRRALSAVFPGRAAVVGQLARLLGRRPAEESALEEFRALVRLLAEPVPPGPREPSATDTPGEGEPWMFSAPAARVCAEFAEAAGHGRPPGPATAAPPLPGLWDGALELVRQATYYAMKRRAGTVGERGLGRVLGELAAAAPGVRVHLVGHSFGARLVSFALRGLPEGVRAVKSVTLLQGAFSHYAFAPRLPYDARAGGVLHGRPRRVDGPLVCCWSRHDGALGTLYPLASRVAGDDRSVDLPDIGRTLRERWGAMGYDGLRSVPGTRACTLAGALRGALPAAGCVNVDASAVVRRGRPPSGAHSDILHTELAALVLAAGRIG
ncbi:serine-threonine protein kinase [Streptomyces fumanus]|uniref:Serine-threonine protein kinase n=1 Tax=Streptomyces fumanus TaxID=67302 RepID=A0A919E5E5_9ACTN|nr:serine-threonine protein kinase [Streptomyces fumanus]GHF15673.1 hypothetical protein GCM10018772_45970 [Streptomyces fumanus]